MNRRILTLGAFLVILQPHVAVGGPVIWQGANSTEDGVEIKHVCLFTPCQQQWFALVRREYGGSNWTLVADWLPRNFTYFDTTTDFEPYEYQAWGRIAGPPYVGQISNTPLVDRECFGQAGTLPSNVVAAACNLDGSAACTGEDIELALDTCEIAGGCTLQLEAKTYDDVGVDLYCERGQWEGPLIPGQGGGCSCPVHRAFPNGLVIQGHGNSTVLRQTISNTPQVDACVTYGETHQWVFHMQYGSNILPLRFRNFVIDGRKDEQTAVLVNPLCNYQSKTTTCTNGEYNANMIRRVGIYANAEVDDVCIHNVGFRNLGMVGVAPQRGDRWIIEESDFSDIGCYDYATACPALDPLQAMNQDHGYPGLQLRGYGVNFGAFSQQCKETADCGGDYVCGVDALTTCTTTSDCPIGSSCNTADNYCYDWCGFPDCTTNADCPTSVSCNAAGGYCELSGGNVSGARVRNNNFNRITKISVQTYQSGLAARAYRDIKVSGNYINDNIGPGIEIFAGQDIVVEDNTIENGYIRENPFPSYVHFNRGIGCQSGAGTIEIRNNVIRNIGQQGLALRCSGADHLLIEGNLVEDVCTERGDGAILLSGDVARAEIRDTQVLLNSTLDGCTHALYRIDGREVEILDSSFEGSNANNMSVVEINAGTWDLDSVEIRNSDVLGRVPGGKGIGMWGTISDGIVDSSVVSEATPGQDDLTITAPTTVLICRNTPTDPECL